MKDTQSTKEAWAQQEKRMEEAREGERRQEQEEWENKKYAQITRVMAACREASTAQEWEQMVQHKAQQHL